MTENLFIIGLLSGMIAALLMNVGKGVQKQYVHVFLNGKAALSQEHRKNLGFWGLGLLMTASSAIFFSIGLKLSESPAEISAMTGIGLIGLCIYAAKVIGEKLGKSDFVGIVMVVIGTSALGYLGADKSELAREFSFSALAIATLSIVALSAIVCVISRFYKRIHGVAFGATAGVCIGLSLVWGDVALISASGSLSGQLLTPYPYVALVFAVSATVVTQFGFISSRAIEVVAAVNSAIILTPLVLEVVLYDIYPGVFKLSLLILIIIGVVFLSSGTASKVSA